MFQWISNEIEQIQNQTETLKLEFPPLETCRYKKCDKVKYFANVFRYNIYSILIVVLLLRCRWCFTIQTKIAMKFNLISFLEISSRDRIQYLLPLGVIFINFLFFWNFHLYSDLLLHYFMKTILLFNSSWNCPWTSKITNKI